MEFSRCLSYIILPNLVPPLESPRTGHLVCGVRGRPIEESYRDELETAAKRQEQLSSTPPTAFQQGTPIGISGYREGFSEEIRCIS